VTTTSQYEAATFRSKTDWRTRALAASHLHLRIKQVYVSEADEDDAEAKVLVLPKNVLKTFIKISDLRTRVAGLMYGASPPDAPQVVEVRAVVLVPQRGSHADCELAARRPAHPALDGLELIGVLRTQPTEATCLSASDVSVQSKELGGREGVTVTCAFTPGSVLLTAFRVTPEGFAWGSTCPPVDPRAPSAPGFREDFSAKATMLLSERIMGFFLVPTDDGVWNYSFQGHRFIKDMDFDLCVDVPLGFYDEQHRAAHFLTFAESGGMQGGGGSSVRAAASDGAAPDAGEQAEQEELADVEDFFA
jgi:pre-mRNA-processing factor 8